MSYTSPFSAVTGAVILASDWNASGRDNITYLYDRGRVRVYHNANQSIANTTATALAFNSERFDSGSYHSTSSNTSRLTLGAGTWLFGGCAQWASNGTGQRRLYTVFGGGSNDGCFVNQTPISGDVTVQAVVGTQQLVGGDYAELYGYQSSGGALNVEYAPSYSPEFWALKVGT